ncbi:MAG: hypothetical protein DCC75_03020 [Proteobacteria bacterium]|nr:MAG: hypothetical protein DCC75_03020 [Pseudomonadota bacterium]
MDNLTRRPLVSFRHLKSPPKRSALARQLETLRTIDLKPANDWIRRAPLANILTSRRLQTRSA